MSFLCKNLLEFFIYVYIRDSIDQSEVRFFELGCVTAAESDHIAPRPQAGVHFLYATCKRLIYKCEIQSVNSNALCSLSSLSGGRQKMSRRCRNIRNKHERVQNTSQAVNTWSAGAKITLWIKFVADFPLWAGENPWPGLRPPQITFSCIHEVQGRRGQAKDSMLSRSRRQK